MVIIKYYHTDGKHINIRLDNVLYVPRASGCFYSTGAATQKGCEAHETRLKHAGRVWYETISKTLQKKLGFQQLHSDAGVHVLHQREGDHEIILILYMDDLLTMGKSQPMIHSIKNNYGSVSDEGLRSSHIVPRHQNHQRSQMMIHLD